MFACKQFYMNLCCYMKRMSNFQRVLIVIFLWIAVTLISGILFPKYLSNQILQIREELNFQSSNSKYGLEANLDPVSKKLIKDKRNDSMSSLNAEEIPNVLHNSILSPEKKKMRSKRQAVSDDEHFHWNFNFSVTGQRNYSWQESSEISLKSHKNKHLGISLYTEGEAKRKSAFDEIQRSLRAVEYFFKYLFTAQNLTDKTINEFARSDVDVAELESGRGDDPLMKGREGKFFDLRKIFGFRVSSEKSISSFTTVPKTESVIKRDDLVTTQSSAIDIISENSQGILNLTNFQAQTLVTEELNITNKINILESSLKGKTENGECVDCDAVGFETSATSTSVDKMESDPSEIKTGSTEFTDEFLEIFCMSLVNKVEVSQHLSDSEELSFEPNLNTVDEHVLRSSENPVTDLLPTSILENELNPEFVSEFFMSNGTSIPENEIRQKKFLSLSGTLGFGSGRAEVGQDELKVLASEKFASGDLDNLPTLLNCENYFRTKNLKMFPKPNLMDIMSDPKIQFADFANATISPNLEEQQLQFLTSLLKTNLDNTLEAIGKKSGTVTESISDEITSKNDRSTLNEVPKEIFMLTEPNDLIRNTKIWNTSTDAGEVQQATELERDGRFIKSGFRSDTGESRSPENDLNRNEVLGSGDIRSLKIGKNRNELGSGDSRSLWTLLFGTNKNEFGSGDSRSSEGAVFRIQKKEFGSGDLILLESSTLGIDGSKLESSDSRSLWTALFGSDKESGSGDSRSLTSETFGTVTDEFGIGISRPHEDVSFGTETNEFGSGFMRSLEEITFGSEIKEFGSGDSRSFKDAISGIEKNELESEESFKRNSDFITETYTDLIQISSNKQRIWSILGLTGSGDGRYLPENLEVIKNFNEINRSSSMGNEVLSGCDECNSSSLNSDSKPVAPTKDLVVIGKNQVTADTNIEVRSNAPIADVKEKNNFNTQNVTDLQVQTTEGNDQSLFLAGSRNGGLFKDSGEPFNFEDESTSMDTRDDIDEKNTDSKGHILFEKPHNERTTENNSRILGTIFLMGSGDGGLFEDKGGPINLLEENTVKPHIFSDRKARLDIPQNISDSLRESSLKQSEQEHTMDNSTTKEKLTSPDMPSRRGRMEDTTNEHCDDCGYSNEDFIKNYKKNQSNLNKDISKFEKRTNSETDGKTSVIYETSITVTASPNVIRSNISVLSDLTKVSKFQTVPCTAARECNVTLNERCITINSTRVCGCSKGYARNKGTSKCIVKKIVETTIKMPNESFKEEFKNPLSPGFQEKRKSTIQLVMLLLQQDPELLRVLSEIDVEFSSGSLVVKLNLVFAAESKSQEQLIKHVEDDFRAAFHNKMFESASLNVSEASLVSINGEIDYCQSSDLNYCSENAYCVSNPSLLSSYACYCKEHYRDTSFDPSRAGETCLAKCPKEYCGAYGHCELLANDERICLCTGLYFGRRCEVPGLYVLIALALVGFVSITMLLLVIFKRRYSRFNYRESQARGTEENRCHSRLNGKVSDAIALEENVGTMKFVSISTPLPHPAVRITRPTITESAGSSYEFDSTFDSTPSTHKVAENAQSTHMMEENSV